MKKASNDNEEKSHEAGAEPAATAKRGKKGQEAEKGVAEVVEKGTRPRKPKTTKPNSAEEEPESLKKPEKVTKEPADDGKSKAEKKTKTKRSKAETDIAAQESSTVAPDVAMDEGPFETMLNLEKEHVPGTAEKRIATARQASRAAKTTKKPAKESKTSNVESANDSILDIAVNGANLAKKRAKSSTEKVRQAANTKNAVAEKAAEVTEAVKESAKFETGKAKQGAKSLAAAEEAPAAAVDIVKSKAKSGAEKIKHGMKSKYSKTVGVDQSVNFAEPTEEQKPGASKSRKRKAPASADAEVSKASILDPLVEDASAKKKQKKETTKAKPIGDTVGELLAMAAEGANAARASLGGIATSIIEGASETVERATGAKKSAKASSKKAKVKGKASVEDVDGSSGKLAADAGPGYADSEDDSIDEPDDQMTALLAGFEGDDDEESIVGSGFQQGQEIPPLPQAETTIRKLEDVKSDANEGPGVVYVGRVPHGFYEHEMREYFSQFGDISRLRLSRNRKSGASKHYAFIEFNLAGVAKIVAATMDNYLMFGHILKCKNVPKEQVHDNIWKGANKRFKSVPWNKIEGRKLEMGLGREQWAGKIEGEKKRRASKNQKTKEIGYEFETTDLKGVDQVPVKSAAKKIENREKVEEEKSLVTAGGADGNDTVVVVSEEIKTKKVKGKSKEATIARAGKPKRALEIGEEARGSSAKKIRRKSATA